MTLNRNYVEWLAIAFFVSLTGVVFQQIHTDLVEQGIADGDAFHNAAFYPRTVAFLILGATFMRVVLLTIEISKSRTVVPSKEVSDLFRPLQLVVLFILYLFLLNILGYHIVTTPFIALTMLVCGERKLLSTFLFSLGVAILIAFIFEKYLNIVLPGGIFAINVVW